jgi:flagellar biosynthesis anti-sigma factor FlgM
MRIELNYGPQSAPEANSNTSTNRPSAGAAAASSALTEDQTQLSGAHLQVQALAAQAAQLPEVRQEKVQALRQAIESGHYDANPEKTAAAVMAHMLSGSAA